MVWFLQHSLWSKNLALILKNKDLTLSWKLSKTANNPGNFTKIGESFIVVTSLVFSLEPIFLKISDRMSPTLALITLSSYPNQNTVEETRSATTIFSKYIIKMKVSVETQQDIPIWGRPSLCSCQTWVRRGLLNAWPPASDVPPVLTHCGSQSWTCDLISMRGTFTGFFHKASFMKNFQGLLRSQMCTLAPVSLQSVCSSVFSVRWGMSLFSCFSFSLGKTFMKLCTSSRMRSRLILLMVCGRKRIILHKHCMG